MVFTEIVQTAKVRFFRKAHVTWVRNPCLLVNEVHLSVAVAGVCAAMLFDT